MSNLMVTQLDNNGQQKQLISSNLKKILNSTLNLSWVNQSSNLSLTPDSSTSSHLLVPNHTKIDSITFSSPFSVIDSNLTQSLANLTSSLYPKAHIDKSVITNHPTLIGQNLTNYANSSHIMDQPDLKNSTSGLSVMLIGLLFIMVCVAIIFLIIILIRKMRLDKLRHHLMPVYNFDPSEDGEDWETELLEEPLGSQNYINESSRMTSFKLDSGLTGGLNIKGPYINKGTSDYGSGDKGRFTAASGLLSDNNNGNHSYRYLYTNEKPVA